VIPKIVFLNPWDRLIGPNRYLFEILRHLPQLARSATVVLDQASDAAEEYEDLGCSLAVWPEIGIIHPVPTPRNVVRVAANHTLGLVRIVKRLRSIRPDLIISNTENLWVGGMGARVLGIRHIQIFHAMTFSERLSKRPLLMKTYLRFLSSWSDSFVAVSTALSIALQDRGVAPAKIARIPNPVAAIPLAEGACSAFSYRGTTLPQDRFPLIVSAGRISPMKGQDLLVRALPAIREAFPNVLCVFAGRIGSGSGLEHTDKFSVDLTREVKRLGLESNVIFAGEVENLPDLLRRAAIYVQPSRTESFGRVVAESLLCGIPVAGFAVGGISESGGPGVLLVPPLDVPALSKAIIRVLEAPALARELAREGRAHVERHFEPGAVAERFFSLVAQASPGAALQERPAWTRS